MYTVNLPYDMGTFVKIVNPAFERESPNYFGTTGGYTVFSPSEFLVWVHGYKESWCGEYLMSEVEPMTEEEIEKVKNEV